MDLQQSAARMMLREVAGGRVDLAAEKMKAIREEELEEMQNELISLILKWQWRDIISHSSELLHLSDLVSSRRDLAPDMLQMAHPLQLKFLVAIKTWDKRFMDLGYHGSQSDLIGVLLGRKCRNIHCLNDFQFEYCHCSICGKTKFCRKCMCVVCKRYDDSRLNSCRWLQCQVCNHRAHTDCVISKGQLEFGMTSENDTGHAKACFRCQACERKSEAFKSVRKTLQEHAPNWNRDHLLEEFGYIFKIFNQSEDSGEKKFFGACAALHASLSNGSVNYMRGSHNYMRFQMLLKELQEMEDIENTHEALERILVDTSEEPIELSYAYLESITNGFSQEIGSGGFGAVYMGVLQNKKVAVKKLSQTLDFSDKQFEAELTCLRVVKHRNIVKFLGHCSDMNKELVEHEGRNVLAEVRRRFLCFEYVPNRSLHDHLNGESYGHKWDTCYQLIEGICQGLHYLHTKERIIHLDLKPQNILVDFDMVPKITDFGLSRRFGEEYSKIITKTIRGSLGYMAPEYLDKGEISFQADIFSLGVIIRKLLCRSNDSSGLDNWHESLDMDNPQVRRCFKIAQRCVDKDRHKRPLMDEIIQMLSGIETPMMPEPAVLEGCLQIEQAKAFNDNQMREMLHCLSGGTVGETDGTEQGGRGPIHCLRWWLGKFGKRGTRGVSAEPLPPPSLDRNRGSQP